MKSSCRTLKLTKKINIFSFILMVIFVGLYLYYKCDFFEILMNLCISVFAGAFVTLLINISTYRSNKTKTLEDFYNESLKILRKIFEIDYLYIPYNIDNITNLIREKEAKKIYSGAGLDNTDEINEDAYYNILLEEYENAHLKSKKKITKKDFIQLINNEIEKYKEESLTIMNQYKTCESFDTERLSSLYGDIEFYKSFDLKANIYNNIYKKIIDLYNDIQKIVFNLQSTSDDLEKLNYSYLINQIISLQNEIFNCKKIESNDFITYTVDDNFVEDVLENLENLRASIYSETPQKHERYPRYVYKISKK